MGIVKGINLLVGYFLKVFLVEEVFGFLVVWSLIVSRVCFFRELVGVI